VPDPLVSFVAPLVVSDSRLALFSARDAGAYTLVLQGFPKPIGVVAPVPEQPVDIWQTAQQGPRPDVIAHLPGRHEEVERPPFAVADGMQLGVHAALGAANQAATPPFFTPRLKPYPAAAKATMVDSSSDQKGLEVIDYR